MMEFIRARWKPVGEGTQESPHALGVEKPSPEQKQKRTKPVSRPDPNDRIHPSECAGDKDSPSLQGEEKHLLGDRRWGDQEERPQRVARK